MALSANTWYQVHFTDPTLANTPPWVTNTFIPGPVTTAILTNANMFVFCVTAGTIAEVAYSGGSSMLPDAVMTVVATPSMNTQMMDSGATWYSIRSGTAWLWYDDITGQVSTLADSTALGAFIS